MAKQETSTPGAKGGGKLLICQNRRARHDYQIGETFEAGIELRGTEVKSLRAQKVHLNEAFVMIENGQAFLHQAHIAEYAYGNRLNHEPTRKRRLLLNKKEIEKLQVAQAQAGKALVPLSLYFRRGWAKLEIGIGTGRKHQDKRQHLKEKQSKREMDRAMSRARKR